MNASTAVAPEISQARTSLAGLSKLFSHRLSLTQVAQEMLQEWIDEAFVGARLLASNSWIGVVERAPETSTYTQLITLSDALIKRCMTGDAINYTPGHHQLLVQAPSGAFQPMADVITVDDIELMLNQLAPHVLAGLGRRLVDYWNARVEGASTTRWHAVSSALRAGLLAARQNPPLNREQARLLLGAGDEHQQLWAYRADREALGTPDVLRIYQVYAAQDARGGEWLPLLVLQRVVLKQTVTLVYIPTMDLLKLVSLESLGYLLPRYMQNYQPGRPLNWMIHEPAGDVFDALAQTLLERQLRQVYRVDWSALAHVSSYQNLFIRLTSPLAWFEPDYLRQPHEEQLPLWLQLANHADRRMYGRLLGQWGHLQQTTGEASFLGGLDTVVAYARKALLQHIRRDYPRSALIDPDAYLLTVGSSAGGASATRRSLTEWCLELPFATDASVQVSHKTSSGQVPGWMTPAYLKQLIDKVDVSTHYPHLLEQALLSDPVEAARRRRLFVEQMAVQLPLRAFEFGFCRLNGFTWAGALMVQAVVQSDPLKRVIFNEEMVARPLAFLGQAGGAVHTAENLFVISACDSSDLPHILYRPEQTEAVLQQFSSRQALLNEITRTGSDLQALVIKRLPPSSRTLFGNGGRQRSRTRRIVQGSTPTSSPVLFSDQTLQGGLLEAVFTENAKRLSSLALSTSVSTETLRWALFKDELWQLFNARLPIADGPAAATDWLLQTFSIAREVFTVPGDASRRDHSRAVGELIDGIAGLIMNPVMHLDERLRLNTVPFIGGGVPAHELSEVRHIRYSIARFPAARQFNDVTLMDFAWSNASGRLNTTQQAELATFQWSPGPGEHGPEQAPTFSADSPVRGGIRLRLRNGSASHASYTLINSKMYGVRPIDDGWRIVDIRAPQRLGPWLRKNRQGVWNVDLGLRLIAGQPKKTRQQRRTQTQLDDRLLAEQYRKVSSELSDAERAVDVAEALYEHTHVIDRAAYTDEHRLRSRAAYVSKLQGQATVQHEQSHLLLRRNANKPMIGFEKEHSLQLEDLVRNRRRTIEVLNLSRRAEQLGDEGLSRLEAQLANEDANLSRAARSTLDTERQTISGYYDQIISISLLERERYAQLLGIAGYASNPDSLAPSAHGAPLDWITLHVQALKKRMWRRRPLPEEHYDFSRLAAAIDEAIQSAQSQKTLDEENLLDVSQRIEGTQANLHEYAAALTALAEYTAVAPDLINPDVEASLRTTIVRLEHESRNTLARLLRRHDEALPSEDLRTPAGNQRWVRDSRKRYQSGRVRAAGTPASAEIIDVIDAIDQTVVVSLQQTLGSSVYEPVPEATAPAARPTRSVENLMADARRLLDREAAVLMQARHERGQERAEGRLARQCEAIKAVGVKIRNALTQTIDTVTQALLDDLQSLTRRYIEQQRLFRIERLKKSPPDEGTIAWLKDQDQLQIVRVGARIALMRLNDFLQEYVVRDKQGSVLAYAHFHYSRADTPDAEYSAGHLKVPSQRFVSYRSLADKPDSGVIEVYYSRISGPLAERLFFSATASIKRRDTYTYW